MNYGKAIGGVLGTVLVFKAMEKVTKSPLLKERIIKKKKRRSKK